MSHCVRVRRGIRVVVAVSLVWCLGDVAARAAVGDSASSFDPSVVAARVGGSEITLGQLKTLIDARSMYRGTPSDDQQRRIAMLDGVIDDSLVSLEARGVSLRNNTGALARVRRAVVISAADLYLQEVIAGQFKLDSITIDTFYNHHITRYSAIRDQRRARIITVWKEGKAPGKGMTEYHDSVYAGWYPEDKIDSLYTRLTQGEDFAQLASMHSEDAVTKGRGGDMGWVSEQSIGPGPVTERILKQPLFMFSRPFESDDAWHIVQATANRPAGPVPMDSEISADVVMNLIAQQKAKVLKELGDSLLAVSKLDWTKAYESLTNDELKDSMIFVVVNRRDTLFAKEYLQEQYKWMDPATSQLPDARRRGEILRGEYIRYLVWYGFLRESGYLDRPEVLREQAKRLQGEREGIVRSRITAGPFPEPDSTSIQQYYQDSIHLYGTAPNALLLAWNSIKSKLVNDDLEAAHMKWRKAAYGRYSVVRFDDRLLQLPLVVPRAKKK